MESWFRVPLGCGCFRAAAWETELGPSSRQSTEALRKFVLPGCSLRGPHLESGTLFLLRFVSVSHVPCVWVLLLEYNIGFSGDFLGVCGRLSWFDSRYMFCISTGRLEELHTFSTLRQTRILIAFPLHSV